jgi:hypothetical protein
MLPILLERYPFSGFLKHSVLWVLFVCPHRTSVFVLGCGSMQNNGNGSILMKTGVFISWVSFSYCELESQPFAKKTIQNP